MSDESNLSAEVKLAKNLIEQVGFKKVMEAFMLGAEPTNSNEAQEMIRVLVTSLAMVTAWEASFHIEDHQGYDCASRVIEGIGERVKEDSHRNLKVLLDNLGLSPVEPTTNERTAAEIMKEIDDNG